MKKRKQNYIFFNPAKVMDNGYSYLLSTIASLLLYYILNHLISLKSIIHYDKKMLSFLFVLCMLVL